MGFLGFRKAKWKSADAQVRLAAIQELTYDQQAVFIELARSDADARVRAAAARRVTDEAGLQGLLASGDTEVVRVAKERLSGVAVKLALEKPLAACSALLSTIDQKSLAEISLAAKDTAVRGAAFERLISSAEPSPAMLALVAVQDAAGTFGTRAVGAIGKRGLLKDIARKAKHTGVQTAAQARLAELEAEQSKPSAEQNRKTRQRALEPLAAEAARLALSNDWERVDAQLRTLEEQRAGIVAGFGELPLDEAARALDERCRRAQRDFAKRRAEHEARIAAALAARADFLSSLAAEQPGDPAASDARRATLQARWAALDGAAAESALQARFAAEVERLCIRPAGSVESPVVQAVPAAPVLDDAQRQELDALLAEAETLVEARDGRAAQDRYRVLHKRWTQLTIRLADDHEARTRFLAAYQRFKERRRAARDERDAATKERIAKLTELAAAAEALAASAPAEDALRAHFDRIRQLQAEWKAVGPVRLDQVQAVRARFRAACDAAYVPVRALQEAEDWERFAQYAKADELIGGVEALQVVEDLAVVARGVRDAQATWKRLGPLPRDKREAARQRFKTACDAQYLRLKPYFAELDAQRAANLESKQKLLAEAESLVGQGAVGLAGSPADVAAKRAGGERLKAIQQEWRAIGPVPREHDEEIWSRFRKACDAFFAQHRADIDARHQEQVANYNLKLALCVAADDLAKDCEEILAALAGNAGGRFQHAKLGEPGERLRAVKELQASWKNIGHVPRDQVEPIWARFRAACDRVYATCKDHLDGIERQRQENLAKKQAIIAEAEDLLKHENARWFIDDLKQLQKQWREVGHVPRENMDELARRFQVINDKIYSL